MDWCDQVTVLGFNCRRYDLNLIKESQLAHTTGKIQVGKKASAIHKDKRLPLRRHYKLSRPGHELRKVGESLRVFAPEIVAA